MRVWVDNREDKRFIRKGKKVFPDMKTTILKVGDVIVENKGKYLCIEHKGIEDFKSSVFDDRLVNQPINMVEMFDYRFIFIVGTYQDLEEQYDYLSFTEAQYNGKIASLSLKYCVPPITVQTDKQFWNMVKSFSHRLEVAGDPLSKPTIIKPNGDDTFVSMLSCIERIGEEKARAILEKYDFWDLPHLTETDLMEINGIGKGYAQKIMKYTHTKG